MEFRLSEFLSYRPSGACFLIPAFIVGNGDGIYTQAVDERGMIEAFHPIDSLGYSADFNVPLGVSRKIGEAAVFAVRLLDSSILQGDFEQVRRELASVDLQTLGTPFFNVDAYAFIGDLAARDQAVDVASRRIGNRDVAGRWRDLEVHGRVEGLSRVALRPPAEASSPEKGPLTWLEGNPQAPEWLGHWQLKWESNFALRSALVRLALDWVRSGKNRAERNIVLSTLLKDWRSDPEVAGQTLSWLEDEEMAVDWSIIWEEAYIYLQAFQAGEARQFLDHLNDLGIRYLRLSARNIHLVTNPARWSKIWMRLNRLPAFRAELLEIAVAAVPWGGHDPTFQRRALAPAFRRLQREGRATQVVHDWLRETTVNNWWIHVASEAGPALPPDIVDKALRILNDEDCRFPSWPTLWRAMAPLLGEDTRDRLATRWLHRASDRFISWSTLLLEMLRRTPHRADLRSLAHHWLRTTRRTRIAEQIQIILQAGVAA